MIRPSPRLIVRPALDRLAALAPLPAATAAAVASAIDDARPARARRELLVEGSPIGEPLLIVSGWAARVRLLSDGRRQLLSFLLPGDLIGCCSQLRPLAVSTVTALTDLTVCTVPSRDLPGLSEAYAVSSALEEAYLLAHITRLGRLTAHERIGDLLLELLERLQLAGLASERSFELPLTQETLADALGLTSVHVNRTLQSLRKQGDIVLHRGRLTFPNPDALAQAIGRTPARVTAAA